MFVFQNGTERIIWVIHKDDPNTKGHEFLGWRRGMWSESRSIHLNSAANPRLTSASHPHVKQWDILLNNVSVMHLYIFTRAYTYTLCVYSTMVEKYDLTYNSLLNFFILAHIFMRLRQCILVTRATFIQ